MSKILFISDFNWQPSQSSWGAWDIPSPYFDEERTGWMLPVGWQKHLKERGIDFEELEFQNGTENGSNT